MLSDSLVESFRARLAALGLGLADLRIGGTQQRPLVQVRIEWPPPAERESAPRQGSTARAAPASRPRERWARGRPAARGPPRTRSAGRGRRAPRAEDNRADGADGAARPPQGWPARGAREALRPERARRDRHR